MSNVTLELWSEIIIPWKLIMLRKQKNKVQESAFETDNEPHAPKKDDQKMVCGFVRHRRESVACLFTHSV